MSECESWAGGTSGGRASVGRWAGRNVHAAHASPPARPPKRPAVLVPHRPPPPPQFPPPPSATGKLKLEPLLRDAELLASYAGPAGRDIVAVALEASGA